MKRTCQALVLLAFVAGSPPGRGQSFHYVEPGNASCQAVPSSTAAGARTVKIGAPVSGAISVSCGFEQGSYTVTLRSTDPGATFAPATLLVNFGRVVGDGVFTVTFATAGLQTVSAAITANMGSPTVPGRFASPDNAFHVVPP